MYYHRPIMVREVLENLITDPSGSYIDCTCGEGGHSYEIVKAIDGKGILICVDKDRDILEVAKRRLSQFKNVYFINDGFENIDRIAVESGIYKFDGVLLDLGVSMYHYANKRKGFSFDSEYPLTMTYAKADKVKFTAYEVVNKFRKDELSEIIFRYGQEPMARKIAEIIVRYRDKKRIETPKELADLIKNGIKRYYKTKIHPATKTFMALRIFVNEEFEVIERFLSRVSNFIKSGGRLCIITFHSGEDKIVKTKMKELSNAGEFRILTAKPIIPTMEEVRSNPSSRSAKLRVYEKV
ncbi:MAG: 16S rRNA (cytosine(1402)-N(4))-methyltransferase RsmH [Spirochaetia bacterium]|nr:16S rRNA (cytosine(1402)-N(4))-methyltransferase RsmH [Spirochaetota bacterium]MCX8096807.1 16S rRNA (cytosine(1402)-N(4))-methyltransferase RsmH [Spirochaetota bacterium]MDW8112776.1 16S rRNA (cytosine(1402)-N(4))-methyltransferase RsmH [Spirochaetia bacterium]